TITSFLQGGPEAQMHIKSLLKRTANLSPIEAQPPTAEAIAKARASEEGQGGMRSFLERKPKPWLSDDS
ncbi:MAG: enoyl-CoA hydratase/isomerase family protein, partial [Candidatus Eisenbacteria bacterium]|nr:enoyl-CoA hydratase/isomerase family protein [Candidatus Eisenbacteria bacterium]